MERQEKKKLLVFGWGLALIILIGLARLSFFKHQVLNYWHLGALGIAVILAVISALRVELLMPVYRVWMRVAQAIGGAITFIILTVIFYVVFGIPGLILRVFRRDLLDENMDRSVSTYWRDYAYTFDRDRYRKQY